MKENIVIIGGIASGPKAAARAKRINPNARVIIFEKENYVSFGGCGLPYAISGVVESIDDLIVRTPSDFKKYFDIDVFESCEVKKIDTKNKKIIYTNLMSNKDDTFDYDKLIIATGSYPVIPKLPGHNLKNILTVKTYYDGVNIKKLALSENIKKVVIIGGGPIGIEMAENLRSLGMEVVIVEREGQILLQFDNDFSTIVKKHLMKNGVLVLTGEEVVSFEGDNSVVKSVITKNRKIDTDLVILSIGFRPNVQLAKDAGIKLGDTGAIEVDEYMRTNIKDIYACGDCCQVRNIVTGKSAWIPLGSIANKQGRVAGENAAGGEAKFEGIIGTMIIKIFDKVIAKTGLSEKEAEKEGFDFETAIIYQQNKAHYYPNSESMLVKLIADKKDKKILGCQIFGKEGTDKRIDVIASLIANKATTQELSGLDLGYAPPFSPVVDPVIAAGNVLNNLLTGVSSAISIHNLKEKLKNKDDFLLLDVREPSEYKRGHIENAINIPYYKIRGYLSEFDKNKEIVIYCGVGIRSYNALRILKNEGFTNVKNLSGGYSFWNMVFE